jgi:hypothetical protein
MKGRRRTAVEEEVAAPRSRRGESTGGTGGASNYVRYMKGITSLISPTHPPNTFTLGLFTIA